MPLDQNLVETQVAHTETRDFRLFLQRELIRRCKANARYSIRAFARLLRTDPSTLSQCLRGKRPITQSARIRFGTRLGLSPLELSQFMVGEREGHATAKERAATEEAHPLTLDAFEVIADWYHYAIFELVTVKDFISDPAWIARKLGIRTAEAQIALERLERLGLLQKDGAGKWVKGVPMVTTTGNPFTAVAFRKLQAQVLTMALRALEEIPIELRDQTSMTMAVRKERIPEAKERIKKFRRELCEFLQAPGGEYDSVYQLGVSLYPLTVTEEVTKV